MAPLHSFVGKLSAIALLSLTFLCFSGNVSSQNKPKKIRGYKVHTAEVSVFSSAKTPPGTNSRHVVINIGEPEFMKISPLGITFSVENDITIFGQTGTVEFITFEDFEVNGLKCEIEEFRETFKFKRGQKISLPKPLRVFVTTSQALRGGVRELLKSNTTWRITGKAYVFGRFNKYLFKFKRVIPVQLNLQIRNPLKLSSD